ncbi:hypothetical protein KR018_004997, partial [Drosophila ironensis]
VTASVTCQGCRLQRYCSKKHRQEDHHEHKSLCRVLSDVLKLKSIANPLLFRGKITNLGQLQMITSQLKLIAQVRLQRRLSWREHHLLGNPAVCIKCLQTEGVQACQGCGAVVHCREEEIKHNSEECRTLALLSSPFRQLDRKLNITKFKACSDISNSHLVEAFFEACSIKVTDHPWTNFEQYDRFATCSSFSGIASMCLALKHASSLGEIATVYVLGDTNEHMQYFQEMHLRFFFKQNPDIQKLELNFIGPNLDTLKSETLILRSGKSKHNVVKRYFPLTFSEFAEFYEVSPDLILLLQPDLLRIANLTQLLIQLLPGQKKNPEEDLDWQDCLGRMLQVHGVPICYTSLSKVLARSDFTAFHVLARKHNVALRRLYNLSENPYREILPLCNPSAQDSERIVYANNYLEIVFTTKLRRG